MPLPRSSFLVLLLVLALTGALLAGPARSYTDGWTVGVVLMHLHGAHTVDAINLL